MFNYQWEVVHFKLPKVVQNKFPLTKETKRTQRKAKREGR